MKKNNSFFFLLHILLLCGFKGAIKKNGCRSQLHSDEKSAKNQAKE